MKISPNEKNSSKNNEILKSEGARRYEDYWAKQMADPEFRALYEEEAARSDLWLQLVEARQAAGLTQQQMAERMGVSQAQVARIEKRDYDAYTLKTLRRYVAALGEGFSLEVIIRRPLVAAPADIESSFEPETHYPG